MRAAILGTFNSGSSLLSQIVEVLGADIGRPLWGYHYESLSMRVLLAAWFQEPSCQARVDQAGRIPFFKAWAEHHEASTGLVCLKHPLLCLCAEDLDIAWGKNYKVIRAHRPLQVSIEKLQARGWFAGHEERMQTTLYEACEQYLTSKDHLNVEYDQILQNPLLQIQRIADYLEVSYTASTLVRAIACVRS